MNKLRVIFEKKKKHLRIYHDNTILFYTFNLQ